jgi:hypothetical protein
LVVVVEVVVESGAAGGLVVVLVVLSDATPLLLRYVVPVDSVFVPSAPVNFSLVVVLKVPDAGPGRAGVAVVVVEDDDVCAATTPVIMASTAAPTSRNLVMSYSPGKLIAAACAAAPLP